MYAEKVHRQQPFIDEFESTKTTPPSVFICVSPVSPSCVRRFADGAGQSRASTFAPQPSSCSVSKETVSNITGYLCSTLTLTWDSLLTTLNVERGIHSEKSGRSYPEQPLEPLVCGERHSGQGHQRCCGHSPHWQVYEPEPLSGCLPRVCVLKPTHRLRSDSFHG